jgi:exosome complex exonuclease RRP6
VKVFHGADWDVKWLQQDFGIYLINMFDTFQAGGVLGLAPRSLASFLKTYCRVDANKEYQLADWRVRPLSEGRKSTIP